MEKKTVLQKALLGRNFVRKTKSVTDEEHEACIAYAKGEISFSDLYKSIDSLSSHGAVYSLIAASFKKYVREKENIEIKCDYIKNTRCNKPILKSNSNGRCANCGGQIYEKD